MNISFGGGLLSKILVSTVVVGAMTSVSFGTFASFAAQTTNAGSGVSSGTLVVSNTKQGGSACLSTGAGTTTDTNTNGACDALIGLSVKKPGDTGGTNLTLKNEGSIPASALNLFAPSCANANASGETYHGTGNLCGKLQVYVQEYSDSAFTTASACRFGGSSDGGRTCDFSDTTKTLGAFATSYSAAGSALSMSGGVAAGAARYFKIGVKLPSDADNTFQGRQATADLTWSIDQ